MSNKLNEQAAARIRRIRDREGLNWSTLGARFGVSPCTARNAYHRRPNYPRRWATAACRLGISVEAYADKRAAGLAHCARCYQWFDRACDEYDSNRYACRPCLNRDSQAKRAGAMGAEERAARDKARAQRRADRVAAQARRLEDELLQAVKANTAELGRRWTATAAAGLTTYSHVTIGVRLRALEARGLVAHGRGGWVLT